MQIPQRGEVATHLRPSQIHFFSILRGAQASRTLHWILYFPQHIQLKNLCCVQKWVLDQPCILTVIRNQILRACSQISAMIKY